MKKDGEDILQGTSLGMEKLHKKAVGTDIEGMQLTLDKKPNICYSISYLRCTQSTPSRFYYIRPW